MKKLILVRHGDYNHAERLSDFGKEQMQGIAAHIKRYSEGESVVILSSTAPRAADSADVLIAELGLPAHEPHEVLWSESGRRENLAAATELVLQNQGTDVVVIVTHFEYAERFPSHFAQKVLGGGVAGIPSTLQKGQAVIIDCEAKTARLVKG